MTARRMHGPGHKDNTRFVFNNTVTAIYVPSKVIYTMFRVNTRFDVFELLSSRRPRHRLGIGLVRAGSTCTNELSSRMHP